MSSEELTQSIRDQLYDFIRILNRNQAVLHHIKAHGALYNDMAQSRVRAETFINAVKPIMDGVKLYAPYKSALATVADKHKIEVCYEAFADRNYNKDLSLVSRSKPDALITSPTAVLEHLVRMVRHGAVRTLQGDSVPIEASTYCIHGDTASALQILTDLVEELPGHRISIEK